MPSYLTELEREQKICARKKKEKPAHEWLRFADHPSTIEPATIQVQISILCFFLHKFLFNLKLCMIVDVYVFYPLIFLDNFLFISLGVIKFGNTVTPKGIS